MPRKPKPRKKPKRVPLELRFKRYEDIVVRDDEETPDEDTEDEWIFQWADDFPELDDLNNIDDFLENFEYEDSDKYQEP